MGNQHRIDFSIGAFWGALMFVMFMIFTTLLGLYAIVWAARLFLGLW